MSTAQRAGPRPCRRRRAAVQTRVTGVCVLFFAVLLGMCAATAALLAWGPRGEAGRQYVGLAVAAGLLLLLGCGVRLVHIAGDVPRAARPPKIHSKKEKIQ